MGFEPMTLHDLVRCSNHWVTGDSMMSKGEVWVFDWNHIAQSHSQDVLAQMNSFRYLFWAKEKKAIKLCVIDMQIAYIQLQVSSYKKLQNWTPTWLHTDYVTNRHAEIQSLSGIFLYVRLVMKVLELCLLLLPPMNVFDQYNFWWPPSHVADQLVWNSKKSELWIWKFNTYTLNSSHVLIGQFKWSQ